MQCFAKSFVKFLAKTKGTQVGQNYEVSEIYMDSALPSQVTRSSKIKKKKKNVYNNQPLPSPSPPKSSIVGFA